MYQSWGFISKPEFCSGTDGSQKTPSHGRTGACSQRVVGDRARKGRPMHLEPPKKLNDVCRPSCGASHIIGTSAMSLAL